MKPQQWIGVNDVRMQPVYFNVQRTTPFSDYDTPVQSSSVLFGIVKRWKLHETPPLASSNRKSLDFNSSPFPDTSVSRKQHQIPELNRNSSCSSSSTVVDSLESKWTSPTRSTITSFRLKFNTHLRMSGFNDLVSVQIYYTSSPPKGIFCTDGANRYTEFSGWLAYWKESRVIHRRTLANKSQSTN